jgi:hypothetical protein
VDLTDIHHSDATSLSARSIYSQAIEIDSLAMYS